jgi:hypothetical protein
VAGVLAKSIAGILVLAVMGVVVGFGRRRLLRATWLGLATLVLASPWFLYNFVAHREWFLADMKFQLITIGSASHQTAQENHIWFYVVRTVVSDLLPLLLTMAAMPALVAAVRRRETAALLGASYAVIYFAGLMVFRFHSEQYLCWFAPALILIAGWYSPLLNGKYAGAVIAVVAMVFVVKIMSPDQTFGISLGSGTNIAAAPVLSKYCGEHRASTLYVLGVDDEFYSSVLPLPQVRYGFVDATDMVAREHPHLAYLGILLPATEVPQLPEKLPVFAERLRAWGIDSTAPVATGISAHELAELAQVIGENPRSDFLVSRAVLPEPEKVTSHRVMFTNAAFSLIEARETVATTTPRWTCAM